jgi:hypothetical protein
VPNRRVLAPAIGRRARSTPALSPCVSIVLTALAAASPACRGGGPASSPDPRSLAEHLERAARACAKLASCARAHDAPGDRDPGACVDAWIARRGETEADALASCVEAAHGCVEVGVCARTRGDPAAAAFCRAHPGERTGCDGARLVTCAADDPAESTSTDCASFGATCGEAKQSGGLLARACLSASLCPAGAPEVRCGAHGEIVACREGAALRTECTGGARCEEHRAADGALSAVCEPPGHRHCDAVGRRWCEAAALVSCEAHGPFGEAVVTDCAALGMACDARAAAPAGGADCVVPGARACEPAPPRCEGGALAFCAAGRVFRVPCRSVGFAACDPDAHGVEAACGP